MLHIRRLRDNQVNAERPRAEMLGLRTVHVSGFIHLSLFRARMQLGEEEKAVTELHKAEEVFRELDDNVYPLKMVRDSWACLKRWKTKRTYVP